MVRSKTVFTDYYCSGGYVPNPSGGFNGLWWHPLSAAELDDAGITEDYVDEVKLQIENDIIAVKIDCESGQDIEKQKRLRTVLYNHFHSKLGDEFKKRRWRIAQHMTVGYIEYDESIYVQRIKNMEDILRGGLLKS